jgi:hypothetical protein
MKKSCCIIVTTDGGDNAPNLFVGVYSSWESLIGILKSRSKHVWDNYHPDLYKIDEFITELENRKDSSYVYYESFCAEEHELM